MLFASIGDFRTDTAAEQRDSALARRAAWKYPTGTKPVAEYWRCLRRSDRSGVTAEFGLKHGQEVYTKWPR
jgi:hypothetical protein